MQGDVLITKAGIYQSFRMAQSFLATAELVSKDGFSSGNHLYSFHLLISNVLELLPKIYIWTNEIRKHKVKSGSKIRGNLIESTKKIGHSLAVLYGSCPELKKVAGIRGVNFCVNEDGFAVYKFDLNNGITINVMNSESARFGVFSEKKAAVSFSAYHSSELFNMAKKLEKYVQASVQKLFPADG